MHASSAVALAFVATVVAFPVRAADEPDELVPGRIVIIKDGKLAKFVAKPPTGMSASAMMRARTDRVGKKNRLVSGISRHAKRHGTICFGPGLVAPTCLRKRKMVNMEENPTIGCRTPGPACPACFHGLPG